MPDARRGRKTRTISPDRENHAKRSVGRRRVHRAPARGTRGREAAGASAPATHRPGPAGTEPAAAHTGACPLRATIPQLLLAAAVVAGTGCAGPPRSHAHRAAASLALLPGTPAPARPAWYDDRLGRNPGVFAGYDGPRLSTVVTTTSGGVRVGFDGRVRDTLRVRTRSESIVTGIR